MKGEKVIKAFEFCLMPPSREELENDICSHEDCPYYREYNGGKCVSALAADALALLKAQEPRLVTESDFDGADEYGYIPVWTEEKDGDMYWECIPKAAITDPDGIGVLRYWTSRPIDAQREATPWERLN